jgi:uncharacterized RDD family membrane protein YckC
VILVTYPRLIRRLKAVAFDGIFIPISMFGALFLGEALGLNSTLKGILFFVPLIVLEPLLVTLTGGTIGHHMMGLKVSRMDGKTHLNFVVATLRMVVRILLGAFSFIVVLTSKKHQAIHDLIFDSIVINKKPDELPAFDLLQERDEALAGYSQKSAIRRILVILLYCLLVFALLIMLISFFISDQCLNNTYCTQSEKFIEVMLNIFFFFSIGYCIVQGWRGVLFGCRKIVNKA